MAVQGNPAEYRSTVSSNLEVIGGRQYLAHLTALKGRVNKWSYKVFCIFNGKEHLMHFENKL